MRIAVGFRTMCALGVAAGLIVPTAVLVAQTEQEHNASGTETAPVVSPQSRLPKQTLEEALRRELQILHSKQHWKPAADRSKADSGPQAAPRSASRAEVVSHTHGTHAKPAAKSAKTSLPQKLGGAIKKLIPGKKASGAHPGQPHPHSAAVTRPHPATASGRPAYPTPNRAAAPQPNSQVIEHLRRLYARDGREMPPMTLSELGRNSSGDAPAAPLHARRPTAPKARPAVRPAGPAVAGAQPTPVKQASSRPGVLQKLFGGSPKPQHHRHPSVASQPRADSVAPNTERKSASPEKPRLLPEFIRKLAGKAEREEHRTPAIAKQPAEAAPIPPRPEETISTADAAPAPAPETSVDRAPEPPVDADFPNPFPELSEAEADRGENPFGSLRLTDDEPTGTETNEDVASKTTEAAHGNEIPEIPAAGEAPSIPELPADPELEAKYRKLRERQGQLGLKGFCPVALRDQRDLVDAVPEFASEYAGKTYHFSSAEAKAAFDADPAKYAPAAGGSDVVILKHEGENVEGSLDFAVWYKDHLYLFGSRESLDEFVQSPADYAVGK